MCNNVASLWTFGDISGVYSWEWQDQRGQWNPYDKTDAVELESSLADDDPLVYIDVAGNSYTVDTSEMTQTNDNTGTVRSVRRGKFSAT